MATSINFETANGRISDWARIRLQDLKASIARQGIIHRQPPKTRRNFKDGRTVEYNTRSSVSQLRLRLRRNAGLVGAISYSIPRQMIYTHKGVGRGTTINQVGNTNRRAKPWYNPVIDAHIDNLADIVAEEIGADIINNILIK